MISYNLKINILTLSLISLFLISGCSLFSSYPVRDFDDVKQELVENGSISNKSEDLNIIQLSKLASLLEERYTNAIRGDVERQKATQTALVALLAATSGAVLFEANSDLLKGLILGTGTIYAYGEMTLDSERRKIYNAASKAYGCIARRASTLVPPSSYTAKYLKNRYDINYDLTKLKVTNTDLQNDISKLENDDLKTQYKQISDNINRYINQVDKCISLATPVTWWEVEILRDILDLHRAITYELSRLEPDFTAFASSISGTLTTGKRLAIEATSNFSPPESDFEDNIVDSLTDFKKEDKNLSKDQSDKITEKIDNIIKKVHEIQLKLSEYNFALIEEELASSIEIANTLPKQCWDYTAPSQNIIATPSTVILPKENGAMETIIIKGINGTPQAKPLNKDIKGNLTPLLGNMAVLELTYEPTSLSELETTVIIWDTSGNSFIIKVKVN